MEVFHYLANKLKDEDNFDARPMDGANNSNTGAIYNDFDSNPLDLLGGITDMPCYSQSSNLRRSVSLDNVEEDAASKKAVDHALLEGDKHESIFVDFLTFKSDLYDITSPEPDLSYMEKVYRIATAQNEKDFEEEIEITDEVTDVYKMRYRNNWQGTDSVYDAWLLVQGYKRNWFPYGRFHRKYPDAKETIERKRLQYQHLDDESCSEQESTTDGESQKRRADNQPQNEKKKYLTESQVTRFFQQERIVTPIDYTSQNL